LEQRVLAFVEVFETLDGLLATNDGHALKKRVGDEGDDADATPSVVTGEKRVLGISLFQLNAYLTLTTSKVRADSRRVRPRRSIQSPTLAGQDGLTEPS